ncbi:hypothetical protein [Streptomyces sp. BF23-19]|uniref:hypothetical protein n=1 Tax=unclassified Streptomyces TaxID=2593676 RepID=UPI0034E3DAD2
MLHISIALGYGLSQAGPGCVLGLAPRSAFGFSGDSTAKPLTHSRRLVRVLPALISIMLLVWGSLYGHVVECVAAVIAAILVDATTSVLRVDTER